MVCMKEVHSSSVVESIYEDNEVLNWSNNVIFVGKHKKKKRFWEKKS